MKLTVECECGNKVAMNAPAKKHLQMRDNLETKQFHFDSLEVKDGKVQVVRIKCDNYGDWITVGLK